jgi:hypothetical protein
MMQTPLYVKPKRNDMQKLINVCERAETSILDELVSCALLDHFPKNINKLVDSLIDLTEFEFYENRLSEEDVERSNRVEGGRLVFWLLWSGSFLLFKDPEGIKKYTDYWIKICRSSPRMRKAFIEAVKENECGAEGYRFELGDDAVSICEGIMRGIE